MPWHALKTNWCRSISGLDFAYALANHRPELKLGKPVSQSSASIQMMSHHMNKVCEIISAPQIFMADSSPLVVFISIVLQRLFSLHSRINSSGPQGLEGQIHIPRVSDKIKSFFIINFDPQFFDGDEFN